MIFLLFVGRSFLNICAFLSITLHKDATAKSGFFYIEKSLQQGQHTLLLVPYFYLIKKK